MNSGWGDLGQSEFFKIKLRIKGCSSSKRTVSRASFQDGLAFLFSAQSPTFYPAVYLQHILHVFGKEEQVCGDDTKEESCVPSTALLSFLLLGESQLDSQLFPIT